MPMDKKRYPDNWKEIALEVKTQADWKCKKCGRQCTKPGESHTDTRNTLTVHHLDHRPENSNQGNLVALCSGCHLQIHGHVKRQVAKCGERMTISDLPPAMVAGVGDSWMRYYPVKTPGEEYKPKRYMTQIVDQNE